MNQATFTRRSHGTDMASGDATVNYSVPLFPTVKTAQPAVSGKVRRSSATAKVVRIICTDAEATESSSSGEEDDTVGAAATRCRRMKRQMVEISFEVAAVDSRREQAQRLKIQPAIAAPNGEQKRYRGVRQRRWGRYAAEIRDPSIGKRLWLGTYDTAEEAATVYDLAAVQLKGDKAVTNFPKSVSSESPVPAALSLASSCGGGEPPQPLSSPISVLQYLPSKEIEEFSENPTKSICSFFSNGWLEHMGSHPTVRFTRDQKFLKTKYVSFVPCKQADEEMSPFDDCFSVGYGDVDAFGYSIAEPQLCLAEPFLPKTAMWKEKIEFGELDDLSLLEVASM